MRGQIGYWHDDDLVVGFDDRMLQWLDAQNTDRRITVHITAERGVIVCPDAGGFAVYSNSTSNALHNAYRSKRIGVPVRPGMLPVIDTALPRFELSWVDFEDVDGLLVSSLDPDHLLAWPRLRRCDSYDLADEWREAVVARLASLLRYGLRSLPHGMGPPPAFMAMKPPTVIWADCLALAKERVGIVRSAELDYEIRLRA